MATQALSAVETVVADGTTYVSSAQTFETRAFMAADMDAEDVVRFEATSTGPISVFNSDGAKIGFVPAESAAVARLSPTGEWSFQNLVNLPSAHLIDATDLATALTRVNAVLAALRNFGILKAE